MSRKFRRREQQPEGAAAESHEACSSVEVQLHCPSPEQVRIESLRLAMDMRSAVSGTRAVILQAKEFETYITGKQDDPEPGEPEDTDAD